MSSLCKVSTLFVKSNNYEGHFCEVLTLSKTSPGCTYLQYKSLENTVGKGEIARNEQFLLFPRCFCPF